MSTKQTLERAREVIARPEDWCQHALVKQRPNGGAAYCALGALNVAVADRPEIAGTPIYGQAHEARMGAFRVLTDVMTGNIVGYNNSHSHECVVAAFDTAIERCPE